MKGRPRAGLVLAVALVLLPRAVHAEPVVEGLAAEALEACEQGRRAHSRIERQAHFARGKALGERAVALDDDSAEAHFGLFCNLGELLRVDGERIPSPFHFRRMMTELERTLELEPEHVDALAAKGVLLIRLPYLLGGDTAKGEALLHDVIRRDPTAVTSRLTLAELYGSRGERERAVILAAAALRSARATRQADGVAASLTALHELGATPAEIERLAPRQRATVYLASDAHAPR